MTTESPVVRGLFSVALVSALAACAPASAPDGVDAPGAATAHAQAPRNWPLPTSAGQQPDLAAAPDGSLLLSWVEATGDVQHLRFARWREGGWSPSREIASGVGIGNTADTPHVRQTPDGALWALWLRKVGTGHARDVVIARSSDDGRTWTAPLPVNTDGTATEHGFASTWTEGPSALGVAWLDGRETADAPRAHGHAMHGGPTQANDVSHATMLRSAVFDARLARHRESAVDTATCDCCQTDVAVLADGPRLVYRDRAPGEIRDIALLTRTAVGWSAPRLVNRDGWRMPGCPVNGPAIAGAGHDVAVAWYTMRGAIPTIRFARSTDGGATFGTPLDLASSADVLGRVDVASDTRGAWVTWLTEGPAGQVLHAAHVAASGATPDRSLVVARLRGTGRGTGWPKLASTPKGVHVVWTDVVEGSTVLRGVVLGER